MNWYDHNLFCRLIFDHRCQKGKILHDYDTTLSWTVTVLDWTVTVWPSQESSIASGGSSQLNSTQSFQPTIHAITFWLLGMATNPCNYWIQKLQHASMAKDSKKLGFIFLPYRVRVHMFNTRHYCWYNNIPTRTSFAKYIYDSYYLFQFMGLMNSSLIIKPKAGHQPRENRHQTNLSTWYNNILTTAIH